MLDLFMSLVLAGFASGFLGWAGLLGSQNELGKLMFVVFMAAAVALALLGVVNFLVDAFRSLRFRRSTHVRV